MADTNKSKSAHLPEPAEKKHPTFHIHNCPQRLIDRANAKAALKGKGVSEWVIEVLKRETRKLEPLQDEYNTEDEK